MGGRVAIRDHVTIVSKVLNLVAAQNFVFLLGNMLKLLGNQGSHPFSAEVKKNGF